MTRAQQLIADRARAIAADWSHVVTIDEAGTIRVTGALRIQEGDQLHNALKDAGLTVTRIERATNGEVLPVEARVPVPDTARKRLLHEADSIVAIAHREPEAMAQVSRLRELATT